MFIYVQVISLLYYRGISEKRAEARCARMFSGWGLGLRLKLRLFSADRESMDSVAFIPLIKQVLSDWRVIFITVAMVFIVSLAKYEVSYRKKPAVVRQKRVVVKKAPPPPPAEDAEDEAPAEE